VWFIASFVIVAVCVKVLLADGSPLFVAGVFAAAKVVAALLLGGAVLALPLTAVLAFGLGFAYFWLLGRFEGSPVWWLVLVCGAVLLV